MLTRQERRNLEAEWSFDDRSIASYARLIKTAVLSIMVVGLLFIAGTSQRADNTQQAAAIGAPAVTHGEGSAVRASQQAFDERRTQWAGKSAKAMQQAATR